MQIVKTIAPCVTLAALVFWTGCGHNGIIIEYHIPSKLNKLVITADQVNGQDVVVKNGVAKVKFDKDGFAKVKTFKVIDGWAQDVVVINGKKLSQIDVDVTYVELKLNSVQTRLPGGGVRSDSIENGTSKIYEVIYK